MKRFCAVDDATLIEKTEGPPNRLFVNGSADTAFRKLLWCLRPTEVGGVSDLPTLLSLIRPADMHSRTCPDARPLRDQELHAIFRRRL